MITCKAAWLITAGIVPGIPMDEFTKMFVYTSDMYEADQKGANEFHTITDEAFKYAREISNPGIINWVNVDFKWY